MSLDKRIGKILKATKKRVAKAKAIGNIENETPIMPWIVADTIIDEVVWYLSKHGIYEAEANRIYERKDDLANWLTNYANTVYKHNASWRKKIKAHGNKGRDTLYAFMRHWLASDLRKTEPAAYRVLGERFAMGEELPR